MSYQVRAVTDAETSLVYSSYIKSLWQRGGGHGQFSYSEHCRVAHERMEGLLASDPLALCVVSPEAPGWVGGWTIGHVLDDGDLAIHWLYVKHEYRRLGLASLLLRSMRSQASANGKIVATHPHHRWREQSQKLGVVMMPLNRALERRLER